MFKNNLIYVNLKVEFLGKLKYDVTCHRDREEKVTFRTFQTKVTNMCVTSSVFVTSSKTWHASLNNFCRYVFVRTSTLEGFPIGVIKIAPGRELINDRQFTEYIFSDKRLQNCWSVPHIWAQSYKTFRRLNKLTRVSPGFMKLKKPESIPQICGLKFLAKSVT